MAFLYGGLACGIAYELLGLIRKYTALRALLALWDALYALACVCAAGFCFVIANGGELRLFGFLLLFSGAMLGRWAFHPLFRML